MKVLSLSVLPFGWGNISNTGMPSVQLALEGYAKLGHSIRYITINSKKGHDSFFDGRLIVEYIKVNRKPISFPVLYSVSQSLYAMHIWKLLYSAGEKEIKKVPPDVIIGNTYYGAVPAYHLAKKYDIPYIFREYGTMDLANIVSGKGIRHKLSKWNEIKAYKLPADSYIFTDDGSNTAKAAELLGVDMGKVHFLRNGIFDGSSVEPSALRTDTFNIVTAARLSAYKHIDDIIRAFSLIQDKNKMCLYIIGDGEQREFLQSLIRERHLEDTVTMTGAIPREQVLSYFKAADIVLALGSINPLMEAMSCSKPVITLELGGTSSFVTDKENVVIIYDTEPQTIANAIDNLFSNQEYREMLGQNAREHIIQSFMSWEERIKKEIEIVKAVGGGE